MPPRYVYWTILIDNKPTAFRAREKEDLLPTLAQLRRTNSEVVLKWFARGRIWDSPEAEQEAQKRPPVTGDKRGHEWRPGGMHKDPRDRFRRNPDRDKDRDKVARPLPRGDRPWENKTGKPPDGAPRADSTRRSSHQPPSSGGRWQKSGRPPSGPPRGDRPWENKTGKPPYGAPRGDRPQGKSFSRPPGDRPQWQKSGRPPSSPPRGDRPWENKTGKPPYGAPRGDRPQGKSFSRPPGDGPQWQKSGRPPSGQPRSDRPWENKTGKPPYGAPRGDSPRRSPQGGGGPQWHKSGKPRGAAKPWQNKPRSGARPLPRPLPRKDRPPPKKRDDEE